MSGDVKKFFIFTAMFLAAFIAVDFTGMKVLGRFFDSMVQGREYNTRSAMREVQPDILFIGASQCQGNYDTKVIQQKTDLSAYNAGMGAQHIDYQVTVADAVITRKKPAIIVWDFDPKLLNSDNHVYLKTGLNPYYHDHQGAKKRLDAVDRYMPLKHLVFSYRYNSLLMQIVNGNAGKKDTRNGYTPFSCGRLKKMAVVDKDDHKSLDNVESERKIALMSQKIQEWNNQGIKVFVFVSPVFKEIKDPLPGIEMTRKICEAQGVPFYDYTQYEPIYTNPGYFRDPVHLCKTGAGLYSDIVAGILNEDRQSRSNPFVHARQTTTGK